MQSLRSAEDTVKSKNDHEQCILDMRSASQLSVDLDLVKWKSKNKEIMSSAGELKPHLFDGSFFGVNASLFK